MFTYRMITPFLASKAFKEQKLIMHSYRPLKNAYSIWMVNNRHKICIEHLKQTRVRKLSGDVFPVCWSVMSSDASNPATHINSRLKIMNSLKTVQDRGWNVNSLASHWNLSLLMGASVVTKLIFHEYFKNWRKVSTDHLQEVTAWLLNKIIFPTEGVAVAGKNKFFF